MGMVNYVGCSLTLVAVGIVAGLVYDIFGVVKVATKKNLIVCIVADITLCLLIGLFFILTIFSLAEGTLALFEILCLVFGIILEQIFIKNIFATINKFVYNRVTAERRGKDKHDTSQTDKPN